MSFLILLSFFFWSRLKPQEYIGFHKNLLLLNCDNIFHISNRLIPLERNLHLVAVQRRSGTLHICRLSISMWCISMWYSCINLKCSIYTPFHIILVLSVNLVGFFSSSPSSFFLLVFCKFVCKFIEQPMMMIDKWQSFPNGACCCWVFIRRSLALEVLIRI